MVYQTGLTYESMIKYKMQNKCQKTIMMVIYLYKLIMGSHDTIHRFTLCIIYIIQMHEIYTSFMILKNLSKRIVRHGIDISCVYSNKI